MPNYTSIYKIMKNDVDIYNAEKHRLPCWNCLVRPTCFSEKKATPDLDKIIDEIEKP